MAKFMFIWETKINTYGVMYIKNEIFISFEIDLKRFFESGNEW